jgi:hypothetical protein
MKTRHSYIKNKIPIVFLFNNVEQAKTDFVANTVLVNVNVNNIGEIK